MSCRFVSHRMAVFAMSLLAWLVAMGTAAQDLGSWTAGAPMATPRQEVGVAALDGLVYVVGGFDASAQSVNTVERYDPASDDWEPVADLPAVQPLNHVGVAVSGGKLYALGGLTQTFTAVATVFCFDPATGMWSEVASMPAARGAMGVAEIDGLIYAAGGLPASRNRDLAVYDPETNAWAPLATMPTGRDHLAAVALGGKFYAISGRAGSALRAAAEVYDPGSNEWSDAADIPTPRGGIATAAHRGRIYVFGGEGNPADPDGVFDEVEEYDPGANMWRAVVPMPLARHGIGAAVVDGLIYLPGGGPIEGLSTTDRNSIFRPPVFPPPAAIESGVQIY